MKTLNESGMITHHAMKSIRGQVIAMRTDQEREEYLKRLIRGLGVKR